MIEVFGGFVGDLINVVPTWTDGVMTAVSAHGETCSAAKNDVALSMSVDMARQYVADAGRRGIEVRDCAVCGGLGDDGS